MRNTCPRFGGGLSFPCPATAATWPDAERREQAASETPGIERPACGKLGRRFVGDPGWRRHPVDPGAARGDRRGPGPRSPPGRRLFLFLFLFLLSAQHPPAGRSMGKRRACRASSSSRAVSSALRACGPHHPGLPTLDSPPVGRGQGCALPASLRKSSGQGAAPQGAAMSIRHGAGWLPECAHADRSGGGRLHRPPGRPGRPDRALRQVCAGR
ncbi:hypothetical protein BDE18_4309 [Paracoccus pantotrophus]|uniref:Uncharacterized protein n=1 Tax=Paracoccus pantotrophus TaxID=82367 RepID=A0ABX9S7I7_PARPN|nr:hypothetical protein BDE18_4309 [Paracoccus pantotrophus]